MPHNANRLGKIRSLFEGNEAAVFGFAYWTLFFGSGFAAVLESVEHPFAYPVMDVLSTLLYWAVRCLLLTVFAILPALAIMYGWWSFTGWLAELGLRRG